MADGKPTSLPEGDTDTGKDATLCGRAVCGCGHTEGRGTDVSCCPISPLGLYWARQQQPPYKPNGATPQHDGAARRWLLRRWECVPSLKASPWTLEFRLWIHACTRAKSVTQNKKRKAQGYLVSDSFSLFSRTSCPKIDCMMEKTQLAENNSKRQTGLSSNAVHGKTEMFEADFASGKIEGNKTCMYIHSSHFLGHISLFFHFLTTCRKGSARFSVNLRGETMWRSFTGVQS